MKKNCRGFNLQILLALVLQTQAPTRKSYNLFTIAILYIVGYIRDKFSVFLLILNYDLRSLPNYQNKDVLKPLDSSFMDIQKIMPIIKM